MNKYEAMFIMRPDLSEDERKVLFNQIADIISKHKGNVSAAAVWAERKKLFFPLKKQNEGLYYLVSFEIDPLAIKEMTHAYKLNENILRVLVTKL